MLVVVVVVGRHHRDGADSAVPARVYGRSTSNNGGCPGLQLGAGTVFLGEPRAWRWPQVCLNARAHARLRIAYIAVACNARVNVGVLVRSA